MNLIGLQEWMKLSHPAVEGRLGACPSAALDAFCETLIAAQSSKALSIQGSQTLITGLQAIQAAAEDIRISGNACWKFKIEPSGPGNAAMTLQRGLPSPAEVGFQLGHNRQPCGVFYLLLGGRELVFSLEQAGGHWALCEWQGDQKIRIPLSLPAGIAVPWTPTPSVDFLDEVFVEAAQSSGGWLAGLGKIRSPLAETPEKLLGQALSSTLKQSAAPAPHAQPLQTPQPSPAPPDTRCPSCGGVVKPGAKFCGSCGKAIIRPMSVTICPGCGRADNSGAKFCGDCGRRLE